jgi:hypothetical protein
MHRLILLATILVALLVASPVAASDNANNWHIHDGKSEDGHAPIGFFPSILGISEAQYLLDPAVCPNATDKVLLGPSAVNANQVVRSGVCMTSSYIIQLRTQDASRPAPDGWTLGSSSGSLNTYVQLTELP